VTVVVVAFVTTIEFLVAVIVAGEVGRFLRGPFVIQSVRAAEPVAVGHEMLLRWQPLICSVAPGLRGKNQVHKPVLAAPSSPSQ
jgi:hypothetical protein